MLHILIATAVAHGHHHRHHRPAPLTVSPVSWYDLSGRSTACGVYLTESTVGLADRTLPCGTRIEFCNPRCTSVPVIDRGPYVYGREFDLTPGAARAVGWWNYATSGVAALRWRLGR